jgi:hypothetical protein
MKMELKSITLKELAENNRVECNDTSNCDYSGSSFPKTPLIEQLINDGENIKFFVDKKMNDQYPLTMKVHESGHNILIPNQAVYLVECSYDVVEDGHSNLLIKIGRDYSLQQNWRENKQKMVQRKCIVERIRNKKERDWNIKSIIKYERYTK